MTRKLRGMTEAEAAAIGERRAREALDCFRGEFRIEHLGTVASPCEGALGELSEDVYFVSDAYQLRDVAPERQLALIDRLRAHLADRGHIVTTHRSWPGEHAAELETIGPDGFRINAMSTRPPTAIGLAVWSPCFHVRPSV
jgi:hypothetical protein